MRRKDIMYAGALLTLKTGNTNISKDKELVELITNKGEKLKKLEDSFPKESEEEIKVIKEISEVLENVYLKIDFDSLEREVIVDKKIELNELKMKLLEIYGLEFEKDSRQEILKRINREENLKLGSLNKEELKLYKGNPLIDLIMRITKLKDEISQFDNLLKSSNDGEIRTNYNLWGSLSGRVISYAPSVQNLPTLYKDYILPIKEGEVVYELDIISAELIAVASLAQEMKIFELLSVGTDIYTYISTQIFKIEELKVSPDIRNLTKKISNGINLGMGGDKLSQIINEEKIVRTKLTSEQGKVLKSKYLELFPNISSYLSEITKNDELRTILAHKFSVEPSYRNLSFVGQNIIATFLKYTLLELSDKKLNSGIVNVVHDSLWISSTEEKIEEIKKVVEENFELMIPEEFKGKGIELVRIKKLGGLENVIK